VILDNNSCGNYGKEISDAGEVLCPDCKGGIRRKNGKRLWYPVAAAALLFLAGSVFWYGDKNSWDFSWDAIFGRPVAVINGEPVTWSEARERFKTTRVILEKQEAVLENVDAIQALAIANQWKWSNKEIKSSVNSQEVVFQFPGIIMPCPFLLKSF
jgi:hypothetical protein